jgi:hypothetical protein
MGFAHKIAVSMVLLVTLIQSVTSAAHCFPERPSATQNVTFIERAAAFDMDCQQKSTVTAIPQPNTCTTPELRSALTTLEPGASVGLVASRITRLTADEPPAQADVGLYSLNCTFRI